MNALGAERLLLRPTMMAGTSVPNARARDVLNDPYWQQLTSDEQRRDEEEMLQDWDNWISKEPPRWKFLEYAAWKREQENGTTRNS